ncbi:hypothetical protein [Streptomyces sp. NBC_00162]|uniref:hypothetical protein n=1 Tax=Streptomyces sp. NBC_00162 TaxID=2903629 RepID=UPI00214B2741|nr:hypothetical protein [Streptomyces sp. NBC_00162]UUU43350.1 hypothetical protein JIW86_33730 [Streptomyces sp. NBC_00162]
MHSEPLPENRSAPRGRRKPRNGCAEGPVFVDNSGRRARLLRRIGLAGGAVCVVYAAVLGMAFMGWGTSLAPSSLLPFGGGGPAPGAQDPGLGYGGPQGGIGTPPPKPTGAPPTVTPAPSVPAPTRAS